MASIDVSILKQFVDTGTNADNTGEYYVGNFYSTGGAAISAANYYTKTELQAGALNDLYIQEVAGAAEQFLFTDGTGDAKTIDGFAVIDKGTYTDISIGKTGDSATRIFLSGQGKIKSAGLGQTLFIEGGNGGANGGHLTLDGGIGSSQDGPINIGTNNALDIDLGSGNTPIYLGGDVSIALGLQVENDVSFYSSASIVGDVSIGNNLFVTDEAQIDYQKGHEAFISGWTGTGYRLQNEDEKIELELDELTVRGVMNIYELVVNKIRVTNGSLWVSDGQQAIYPGEDTSTHLGAGLWWESTGSYQYHWYYYNDASLNTFREDDLIKAQRFDGTNVGVWEFVCTSTNGIKTYVRDFGTERNDGGSVAGEQTLTVGTTDGASWNNSAAGYDWEGVQNEWFITNTITVRGKGQVRVQGNYDSAGSGDSLVIQVRAADATLGTAISTFGYYTLLTGGGTFDVTMDVLYDLGESGRPTNTNAHIQFKLGAVGTNWADEFNVTSITDMTLSTYGGDNNVDGFDFARVGNLTDTDRQGSLYLTSSDQDAPYMDVLDEMDTFSIGVDNNKVRIGKLDGINDPQVGGALSGYGLYTDNAYLKGSIWAADGSIAGWNITQDSIFTGVEKLTDNFTTSGVTIASNGSIRAQEWYLNSNGDAAFNQIEDAIFKTDTNAEGIRIQGGNIWEDASTSDYSFVRMNYHGYNNGTDYKRNFIIYDGTESQIWYCAGASTNLASGSPANWYMSNTINHWGPTRINEGIGYLTNRSTGSVTLSRHDTYHIESATGSGRVIKLPDEPIPGQRIVIKNASPTYTIDVSVANGTYPLYTTSNQSGVTIATGKSREFLFDWGSASDPFPGTKKWQVIDYS